MRKLLKTKYLFKEEKEMKRNNLNKTKQKSFDFFYHRYIRCVMEKL